MGVDKNAFQLAVKARTPPSTEFTISLQWWPTYVNVIMRREWAQVPAKETEHLLFDHAHNASVWANGLLDLGELCYFSVTTRPGLWTCQCTIKPDARFTEGGVQT
jgi:hypothetical protein